MLASKLPSLSETQLRFIKSPDGILPQTTLSLIENFCHELVNGLDRRLWDEAFATAIVEIKNAAIEKTGVNIAGDQFVADLNNHIEKIEEDSIYQVRKR